MQRKPPLSYELFLAGLIALLILASLLPVTE